MFQPFLVTGCGRSGTTWASHIFTRLGYPTWHERQFSTSTFGPLVVPEASWLAMPFVDQLPSDVRILRMVRNPYDVISSIMQLDFQVGRPDTGNAHDAFLLEHGSSFITDPDDKLTRAIRWVTTWDYPLNDHDHLVIPVDLVSAQGIVAAVKYATKNDVSIDDVRWSMKHIGTNVNTKKRTRHAITRRDIDEHHEGWRVRRRAERLGYR